MIFEDANDDVFIKTSFNGRAELIVTGRSAPFDVESIQENINRKRKPNAKHLLSTFFSIYMRLFL
jgi:hypothetical protein